MFVNFDVCLFVRNNISLSQIECLSFVHLYFVFHATARRLLCLCALENPPTNMHETRFKRHSLWSLLIWFCFGCGFDLVCVPVPVCEHAKRYYSFYCYFSVVFFSSCSLFFCRFACFSFVFLFHFSFFLSQWRFCCLHLIVTNIHDVQFECECRSILSLKKKIQFSSENFQISRSVDSLLEWGELNEWTVKYWNWFRNEWIVCCKELNESINQPQPQIAVRQWIACSDHLMWGHQSRTSLISQNQNRDTGRSIRQRLSRHRFKCLACPLPCLNNQTRFSEWTFPNDSPALPPRPEQVNLSISVNDLTRGEIRWIINYHSVISRLFLNGIRQPFAWLAETMCWLRKKIIEIHLMLLCLFSSFRFFYFSLRTSHWCQFGVGELGSQHGDMRHDQRIIWSSAWCNESDSQTFDAKCWKELHSHHVHIDCFGDVREKLRQSIPCVGLQQGVHSRFN